MDLQGLSFNQTADIKLRPDAALKLQAGDVVRGLIQSTNSDGMVQLLVRGKTVLAEAQIPVQAGQELYLQVDRMENGKLYLRVVDPQVQTDLPDLALRGLLTKIGLKSDEMSSIIARKLIAYNLPVSRENIETISKMINLLPDGDGRVLETAVYVLSRGQRSVNSTQLASLVEFFSSPNSKNDLGQALSYVSADYSEAGTAQLPPSNTNADQVIRQSSAASPAVSNNRNLPIVTDEPITAALQVVEGETNQVAKQLNQQVSSTKAVPSTSVATVQQATPITAGADMQAVNIAKVPVNTGVNSSLTNQPAAIESNLDQNLARNSNEINTDLQLTSGSRAGSEPSNPKTVSSPSSEPSVVNPGTADKENDTNIVTSSKPTLVLPKTAEKVVLPQVGTGNEELVTAKPPPLLEAVEAMPIPAAKANTSNAPAPSPNTSSAPVADSNMGVVPSETLKSESSVLIGKPDDKPAAALSRNLDNDQINNPALPRETLVLTRSPGSASSNSNSGSLANAITTIEGSTEHNLSQVARQIIELIKPALEATITNLDQTKPDGQQIKQVIREQQTLLPELKLARQVLDQVGNGVNHPLRAALDQIEQEWNGQALYNRMESITTRDQGNYYLTLPLRWQGVIENAELSVNWRRDARPKVAAGDYLTINVGMNTINLGAVIFHLRAQGHQIGLSVYLENEPAKAQVDQVINGLLEHIRSLGYETIYMGSQVVTQPTLRPEFIDDAVKDNLPPVTGLDLKV